MLWGKLLRKFPHRFAFLSLLFFLRLECRADGVGACLGARRTDIYLLGSTVVADIMIIAISNIASDALVDIARFFLFFIVVMHIYDHTFLR